MKSEFISIIIPTFNAGPSFSALLERIMAQNISASLELVIIDSGSTDGTVEVARKAGARVLSIPQRRFNHGRARNQAINAGCGDYVALTVQDALPADSNWLATLVAALDDTEVAASYGRQIAPSCAGPLAQARSLLWQRANAEPRIQSVASPTTFWGLPPAERLQLAAFDDVTACLRRSVWEKIPLPELSYGEDQAWAVQALLQGYRIAYVPAACVEHAHERTMAYELRRAFVNGRLRTQILAWPSLALSQRVAFALWREACRPQLVRKYGNLCDPTHILERLYVELGYCNLQPVLPFVQVYRQILDFSWGLVETARELFPGTDLPERLWSQCAHFATVAVIGEVLGNAAPAHHAPLWWALGYLLGRGV